MVESKDIIAIVKILRRTTALVKWFPFIYTAIFIITMCAYYWISEDVANTLDTILYTSPMFMLFTLILSRILKLCKWHRLQCCLPLYPIILVGIDNYLIHINRVTTGFLIASVIALCVITLINAYFVFRKPKTHNTTKL